jgi:hypothetical protein
MGNGYGFIEIKPKVNQFLFNNCFLNLRLSLGFFGCSQQRNPVIFGIASLHLLHPSSKEAFTSNGYSPCRKFSRHPIDATTPG